LSLFAIDLTFPVFVSEYKTALRQFPNLKTNAVEAFTILEENPRFGDAIPGFDQALWKTRLGVKGRFGKRGGYRMIYHVDWQRRVNPTCRLPS
jgi:mRNA-degrading endonuclease RelE of RelBE toxin-antitoxin system